jgi:cardiolipin synthase
MEVMFAQDLGESEAITLEGWQRRSWLLRLKEQAARLGAYWL